MPLQNMPLIFLADSTAGQLVTDSFTETSVAVDGQGTLPEDPGEKPSGGTFGPEFFIAMAVFLVASIFLIQRPQKKAQAAREKVMKEGMKKGQKIVSAGGIHGSVLRTNKNRDTIIVQVAKGVEMEFNRASLTVIQDEPEEVKEKK
jgi:preprotein translocase subunit YajC